MVVTLEEVKSVVSDAVKAAIPAVDEVAEKVALEAKIDAKVDEKLKSIKLTDLPNLNLLPLEKELKVFDMHTGKIIGIRKVNEEEAAFNRMLRGLATRDLSDAKAISNEIDQQNDADYKVLGHKAPTPARSDSVAVGGYAVPSETDAEIMQMIYASSVMYANMSKDAIIANGKIHPLMYGIAVVDIADQGTAATESTPTFTNPTVSVARAGAFTAVSNEFLSQKGIDLVTAFTNAYTSAMARFLDLRLAVGNVTNDSDLLDGLVFDALTVLDTAVTKANFVFSTMEDQLAAISDECNQGSLRWIGNRVVKALIGNLENGAGYKLFPQYASGGDFSPLGIPFILNTKIGSALDVGGDKRTTGTDNVLILADMSKCVTVLDNTTRIDLSKDYYFTTDLSTIRGIKRYGGKVLVSTTASTGGVCRAQEISA
jgi:HK97 family phage major capsid protein